MPSNIVVIIPARYGSTRFPGKPLAEIAEKSMIRRVIDAAREGVSLAACQARIIVTTDDCRIADHVRNYGTEIIMTPSDCQTGSDRICAAIEQLDTPPEFALNLQGDAPFTPPSVIAAMISSLRDAPAHVDVVTPAHALSWAELDQLRKDKQETPFSGTTAVFNPETGHALWFSKQILPALRKENRSVEPSPVYQHLGLYGYRVSALQKFVTLPEGVFEKLEGLEQLRMLENGFTIQCIPVDISEGQLQSGIDTPRDLARAEAKINQRAL